MTRQKKPFWRRLWQAALLLVPLPIILPLVLIALVLYFPHRLTLYMLVWVLWLSKGLDVLVCVLRQPDMARIHGDTDLAASTRAGHCFEFGLNAANGRDGHFTSMYFTVSVATASLTPGGIVPAIFVVQEPFASGHLSRIGNGVTGNLWSGCGKNCSPFCDTRRWGSAPAGQATSRKLINNGDLLQSTRVSYFFP